MDYHTYKPSGILSDIVCRYWSLEGEISADQTYVHRTLANYCPELIFHYGGAFEELVAGDRSETTFITGIHGQTDRIRRFTAKEKVGIFGVVLQPYAIPLLFGVPSTAINNGLIDLAMVLGGDGRDIAEKIMLARDNTERVRQINRFIEDRMGEFERPEVVNATHQIYQLNGLVDIERLAGQSCLSKRQFERIFKEHIGFSPKSFARIVRFKSLIGNFKKKDSSLTELAYESGYYDQAHFINDFKQFSGYTPNAYFSGRGREVFYAP